MDMSTQNSISKISAQDDEKAIDGAVFLVPVNDNDAERFTDTDPN